MWSFSSPSYKLPVILPGAILMNPCFLEQTRLHWYKTKQQTLVYWERLWCWEGLRAGGEGDDRGWDGWMASLTRWTWVWVNPRSWWWTGRPGVLRFMGSQRVGHDWVTELTDWLTCVSSHESTDPIMKTPSLWPNCLPKAPSPNSMPKHVDFEGSTQVQSWYHKIYYYNFGESSVYFLNTQIISISCTERIIF